MIVEGVKETAAAIGGIAEVSSKQADNSKEVAAAIAQIAKVTEDTVARGEEMAPSSQQLTTPGRPTPNPGDAVQDEVRRKAEESRGRQPPDHAEGLRTGPAPARRGPLSRPPSAS